MTHDPTDRDSPTAGPTPPETAPSSGPSSPLSAEQARLLASGGVLRPVAAPASAASPARPEPPVGRATPPEAEPAPPELPAAQPAPTQAEPVTSGRSTPDPVPTASAVTDAPLVRAPVPDLPDAEERPADDPSDEQSLHPGAGAARPHRRLLLAGAALALAAVVAVVAALVVRGQDALPDDAAFRAAGVVVTEEQVARRTEVLRALYGVTVPDDAAQRDAFRRDTAKALAVSTVLEQAAEDEGIRIGEKTVRDTLDKFIEERYPDDGRESFVAALAAQGVGEADVLAEIRRQLAGRELFDRVTEDVDVSVAELREVYDRNPRGYDLPERRWLRHIVLADEQSAQAVLRTLRGGADFAATAAASSLDVSTKDQGGDLTLLSAEQLDPAFAAAAFRTPSGQLFGPVRTDLGWHVGRVDQVVVAQRTTFEQVLEGLREQQVTERAVSVWRAYLDDGVREADITYAPDYQPADTSLRKAPVPSGAASSAPGPGASAGPS